VRRGKEKMKRIMQAVLAVALLLVTAFTFYVDTASAQPFSAPVPANCTTGYPCNQTITCRIPKGEYCNIPNQAQRATITIINKSNALALVKLSYGGNMSRIIKILAKCRHEPFSINPNGGAIAIYNDSSVDLDLKVSLVIERSAVVPEK
jgi:hypothetical protein